MLLGIVIAKGDLTQYVPLGRGSKEVITTQYNDEALLKMGLLKMDFLGLRTLTVIDGACRFINERHRREPHPPSGHPLPEGEGGADAKRRAEGEAESSGLIFRKIPLDDATTYKLLQDAQAAIGIFQLESSRECAIFCASCIPASSRKSLPLGHRALSPRSHGRGHAGRVRQAQA